MEFLKLVQERYSVRKFLSQEVEPKKLEELFKCAQTAPTAANFQPVRYYLLESEQAKENISKITRYRFNAPVWILVGYDSSASWTNKYTKENKGDIDCSIAITHIMLAATNLGLGTCWIGSFDPGLAKELYNLPSNFEAVALIPIGYPDLSVPPNPLHFERTSIHNHIKKI